MKRPNLDGPGTAVVDVNPKVGTVATLLVPSVLMLSSQQMMDVQFI